MMEQYRINQANGMEFGLYSLGDHIMNPLTGERISAQKRIQELIEMSKLAEQAGIDVFSVGESHQTYFVSQAHTVRSEEHTSELQSRGHLVCRLLLEKKKE